jgi:lipopolysaccharide export LptBFGC system permease protein LptF
MVRMSIAGVGGFILVFIESYIVMQFKGYQTIDFGGISPFISVWAMNFFLLFSILTQVKDWYLRKEEGAEESYID